MSRVYIERKSQSAPKKGGKQLLRGDRRWYGTGQWSLTQPWLSAPENKTSEEAASHLWSCHWEFPYYWARKFGQIDFILINTRILLTEIRHDITMTIPTESVSFSYPYSGPSQYILQIWDSSHSLDTFHRRTARGTFNPILQVSAEDNHR